jgi:TolB protein
MHRLSRGLATSLALALALAGCADEWRALALSHAEKFAPGIASTRWSDVRLTISPEGDTALWFSRDRPGGPGNHDIWISRRVGGEWRDAVPAPFNTPARDFDPAFSADGAFVYFCSDRPGGHGGDDIWRVRVAGDGFGEPELLDASVNTPGNEWAPMLSADGETLLFASNGHAGAKRLDLFTSNVTGGKFAPAIGLPAPINTGADEFDATFLADGRSLVFSRARDISSDPVQLYHAPWIEDGYLAVEPLSAVVNTPGSDTYAPMLDWSQPDRFTFTTRRPAGGAAGVDVYLVRYR